MITADPNEMKSLKSVIAELDIRRAQIHIEAIIVEVSESEGLDLGVQIAASPDSNKFAVMQFKQSGNTHTPSISEVGSAFWGKDYGLSDSDQWNSLANAAGFVNGFTSALQRRLGLVNASENHRRLT